MTSASDKPTTMAARPTAQECPPDRRLEERLARLAAALQPRPSVTSQIALDTPDPTQTSATSAGDKPAEVRRAWQWPQTATIAVSLAVAIAGWWLYRSEVANHAEMISAATRAAGDVAEVKQALQQERDRTENLTQELATAQRTLEAEAVALAKASDKTAQKSSSSPHYGRRFRRPKHWQRQTRRRWRRNVTRPRRWPVS